MMFARGYWTAERASVDVHLEWRIGKRVLVKLEVQGSATLEERRPDNVSDTT